MGNLCNAETKKTEVKLSKSPNYNFIFRAFSSKSPISC